MKPENVKAALGANGAAFGLVSASDARDNRRDSGPQVVWQRAFLASRYGMPADPLACQARLTLLSEPAFSTIARRA